MEQQREIPQFYLHVTAVSKTRQPPFQIKQQYGPYASVEEAQGAYSGVTQEPGYEYTFRVNQEPYSK
jgi:hypothetical protein